MNIKYGKKYRIVKKFVKRDEDKKLRHYYMIEEEYKTLFGRTEWRPLKRIWFNSFSDIEKYVKNLLEEVPEDEVVRTYEAFACDNFGTTDNNDVVRN